MFYFAPVEDYLEVRVHIDSGNGMQKLSKVEKINLALAFAAIILSMAAVIFFIYFRSSVVFYLLTVAALCVGFYMTYFVSKYEQVPKKSRKGRS